MTLRHQDMVAARERRAQGAPAAALGARLTTCHRAWKRFLGAAVSFFGSPHITVTDKEVVEA